MQLIGNTQIIDWCYLFRLIPTAILFQKEDSIYNDGFWKVYQHNFGMPFTVQFQKSVAFVFPFSRSV